MLGRTEKMSEKHFEHRKKWITSIDLQCTPDKSTLQGPIRESQVRR